jgi:hypothetical protein
MLDLIVKGKEYTRRALPSLASLRRELANSFYCARTENRGEGREQPFP